MLDFFLFIVFMKYAQENTVASNVKVKIDFYRGKTPTNSDMWSCRHLWSKFMSMRSEGHAIVSQIEGRMNSIHSNKVQKQTERKELTLKRWQLFQMDNDPIKSQDKGFNHDPDGLLIQTYVDRPQRSIHDNPGIMRQTNWDPLDCCREAFRSHDRCQRAAVRDWRCSVLKSAAGPFFCSSKKVKM